MLRPSNSDEFIPSERLARIQRCHRLQQGRSCRRKIYLRLVLFLLLGLALLAKSRLEAAQGSLELHFANSPYQDIKIQHQRRFSLQYESLVSYPVTNQAKINQTIQTTVQSWMQDFSAALARQKSSKKPWKQTIDYQIFTNSQRYLSLALSNEQNLSLADSYRQTKFWTFDKTSGEVLSVKQLFRSQPNQAAAFLDKLVLAIQARLQSQSTSFDPTGLRNKLKQLNQLSFIIKDSQHIELAFDLEQLGLSGLGELTVSLKNDDLKTILPQEIGQTVSNIESWFDQVDAYQKATEKRVALSFDDGPSQHTVKLLDILADHKVKATFFIVGRQLENYSDAIRLMVDQGHEVASHTFRHPNLGSLSPAAIEAEISQTQAAVQAIVPNYKLRALRPPYGIYNQTVIDLARKYDLGLVLWSVDPRDWADQNADLICNRVVSDAKHEAIVLLHDLYESSVAAVPCIINRLQQAGYRLMTVSELYNHRLAAGAVYP